MKRSLWLLTLGTLFTTLNLPVAGHDLLATGSAISSSLSG